MACDNAACIRPDEDPATGRANQCCHRWRLAFREAGLSPEQGAAGRIERGFDLDG